MIYFFSVLLWISPQSVEIAGCCSNRKLGSRQPARRLLVVLEKLHLAKTLLCFFARPVRAAEIFSFLLRHDFISAFHFFDHSLPSYADSAPSTREVNTVAAV
jgi:hypothetical protein